MAVPTRFFAFSALELLEHTRDTKKTLLSVPSLSSQEAFLASNPVENFLTQLARRLVLFYVSTGSQQERTHMGVLHSAVSFVQSALLALALPLAALYLLSHLMARIYRTVGRKATVRLGRLPLCSACEWRGGYSPFSPIVRRRAHAFYISAPVGPTFCHTAPYALHIVTARRGILAGGRGARARARRRVHAALWNARDD